MKDVNLKKILDEILRNEDAIIDPEKLYSHLERADCLTRNEVRMIKKSLTDDDMLLKIFTFLKSKNEINVFRHLQRFYHDNNDDLLELIQSKLKEIGRNDILWEPCLPRGINSDEINEKKLLIARNNLKKHYAQDLEVITNYWQKFNVGGDMKMDDFYNANIIIKDKKEMKTFKDLDELFSTGSKRFVITAEAGYGKSTFIHEMAHQWVKNETTWSKRFSFLFLIRLWEVDNYETLENLIEKCLRSNDSEFIRQCCSDTKFMEKCLFVFDGLDELQRGLHKEVDDMILGIGVKDAHVVVTSRSTCRNFKNREDRLSNYRRIELNGYTKEGIEQQLKKFNIIIDPLDKDIRKVLEVPLFNMLYCITHKESKIGCQNFCFAIAKFVKVVCKRFRETDESFSKAEKKKLLMALGYAAQKKFSFMKILKVNPFLSMFDKVRRKLLQVSHPKVTSQLLSYAINAGLVLKTSTKKDFVFVHQTIAEYCAAYYFTKAFKLKAKYFQDSDVVCFSSPRSGLVDLDSASLFSVFLCHFHEKYRKFLWDNFKDCVPYLNNYEDLSTRTLTENELNLRDVPDRDRNTILEKIEFSNITNELINLHYINFEPGKLIENITGFKDFQLHCCSMDMSPEEFFRFYNVQSLFVFECIFKECGEEIQELPTKDLILESLQISCCDFTVTKFLAFIMKHCTSSLKLFKIYWSFESEMKREKMSETDRDYFGIGWIDELRENQNLLKSIEHFELDSFNPSDLSILFLTLGLIIELKTVKLTIHARELTDTEMSSLKVSLEELEHLESFTISVEEQGLDIENYNGTVI